MEEREATSISNPAGLRWYSSITCFGFYCLFSWSSFCWVMEKHEKGWFAGDTLRSFASFVILADRENPSAKLNRQLWEKLSSNIPRPPEELESVASVLSGSISVESSIQKNRSSHSPDRGFVNRQDHFLVLRWTLSRWGMFELLLSSSIKRNTSH